MLKSKNIGIILVAIVTVISLGIYMVQKKESKIQHEILMKVVNHSKNVGVNINIEKNN